MSEHDLSWWARRANLHQWLHGGEAFRVVKNHDQLLTAQGEELVRLLARVGELEQTQACHHELLIKLEPHLPEQEPAQDEPKTRWNPVHEYAEQHTSRTNVTPEPE